MQLNKCASMCSYVPMWLKKEVMSCINGTQTCLPTRKLN